MATSESGAFGLTLNSDIIEKENLLLFVSCCPKTNFACLCVQIPTTLPPENGFNLSCKKKKKIKKKKNRFHLF